MGRHRRVLNSEFPIHVTARVNNREHFPCSMEETWDIISDYLYIFPLGFEIKILSFVLMPNHLHMLVRDPFGNLPNAMAFFMRETSREMGRISKRINKIWGGPYHSSIVDSYLYYLRVYKYVYQNPIRACLCQKVQDYKFSTLSMLLGINHSVIPLSLDELLTSDPDETLSWLNKSYDEDERIDLKNGLRKKKFKIRLRPATKKPSPLETWDSLPAHTVDMPVNSSGIPKC